MKNILYIPLDERPCNLSFLPMISKETDYNIVIPPTNIFGYKKTAADIDKMWNWIFDNINTFDFAILSIDMLVYGGILPSRLHHSSLEHCKSKLNNIKKIKELNSKIKIYAFNLIMRCPSYSSSDEEPDYYEDYGKEIFQYGYLSHKRNLEIINEEEIKTLDKIKEMLPSWVLEDYTHRRKINGKINKYTMELVKDNTIDFLVIPQDDSAPFGFTAVDQHVLRDYIHDNRLDFKVYMYPGADEVGLTLFSRLINEDKGIKPCVYTRFSSVKGPCIMPLYEDRLLYETIKYQILCAGCIPVEDMNSADLVLMVNSPAEKMYEAWEQNMPEANYNVNKNLIEFVEFIDYIINIKKLPCAVADVAYSNGGDIKLIQDLSQKDLLFKVASYAGWNTNSNTLGTTICQAMIYNIYGKTKTHLDFLALRYVEDTAYCSHVRKLVTDNYLPKKDLNYFKTDGQRGEVSNIVKKELTKFSKENFIDKSYEIEILDCFMPWDRMFEVGLDVKVKLI